jgi:rhamnose utilization protein RhaD (predicted bifunctional aldolase and dehydrogenase)
MAEFKFVKSLWDDEYASKLSAQDLLIYRSNILGADQNITNTGGGNTSAKITEKDPLTGAEVEVLWVKGSGGDLRTSKKENFSTLYNQKILELRKNYLGRKDKGYKTPAEDSMVDMYSHCTFNLNPRATSIDTPLHSFIAKNHVDHMHATSVIAVAACVDQVALTKKIWGDEMDYVPWLRPGLELALKLQETFEKNRNVKGILMGQHGFISWDNTSKECYFTTLKLIEKAAEYISKHDQKENTFGGQKYAAISAEKQKEVLSKFLPIARGEISKSQKFIGTVQQDDLVSSFVNSFDATRLAEMGTSCPDHFLRTKIKPLFLDWNPQTESVESLLAKFKTGIKKYREDYAAYYEKNKEKNSPAMRDPNQ